MKRLDFDSRSSLTFMQRSRPYGRTVRMVSVGTSEGDRPDMVKRSYLGQVVRLGTKGKDTP